MNLNSLGWLRDWDSLVSSKDFVARIVAVHRSHYKAICEKGELILHLSGKYQNNIEVSSDYPAVGDWVVTSPPFIDENSMPAALIEDLIPRKSKISRVSAGRSAGEQVIAANVDYIFIVTSANQDFSLNRLQRYILLANEGGAQPIVVLSKVDLNEQYGKIIDTIKGLTEDIAVVATSMVENKGLEEILEFLKPETTSVFVGSSGVGKSTLVNHILGDERQFVNSIREDDDKGRHTTTSRELFFVPQGGMIIDTPGLREVQVFGDEESLTSTFGVIEELSQQCKFGDCSHQTEPGCAVLSALESGELSPEEFQNYEKLLREMAYSNRKMDKAAHSNHKKKWRQVTLNMRQRRKFEGW